MKDQIELSAENLWSEISGRLREALNDGTYGKWFGGVESLEREGETLVLTVPDELSRDWIHRHFRGLVNAAVRDITGESHPLELRVAGEDEPESENGSRQDGVLPMVQRPPGRGLRAAASRRSTRSTPS